MTYINGLIFIRPFFIISLLTQSYTLPAQNIISLGFNVDELSVEQKRVLTMLTQVYDATKKLDGIKIAPANISGLGDLNKFVTEQNRVLADLNKTMLNYEKQQIATNKAEESRQKAILATTKAENEAIKQIELETKAQSALEKQAQKTALAKKEAAEIPFTTNLNDDGSIQQPTQGRTTGDAVSAEELALTEAQLQAQRELDAQKQQSVQTNTKLAASTAIFTTAIETNVAALIEDEAALAANKAQLKLLTAEIAKSGGATVLQTQEMVALRTEQFKLNESIASTRANVKNLTKEFLSDEGSIVELRAQVNRLTASYEALSAAEKRAAIGVNLKTQLNTLQPALQKAEGEIGKFQRNVGNYAGGIQKAFTGAFSYIRQLANILPGIGLAGLFGLAFEGISKLTEAIFKGKDALDEFAETEAHLNEAFKDNELKTTVENIERLKVAVDSAKSGLIDKEKVVKEYNETLGTALGTAKDFNDVEDIMSDEKRLNAYVKSMLYRAAANLALQKAAEAALKAEEDRRKSEQEFNTIGTRASVMSTSQTAPGFVPGLNDVNAGIAARAAAAKKGQDAAVKLSEDEKEKQEDIAKKFFADINKLTKEFNLNFNPLGDSKDHTAKVKKTIDEVYLFAKNELEHQIKDLQDFVNNGTILFNERFAASEELQQKEIELSNLVLKNEIKNGKGRVLAEQENAYRIEEINKRLVANLTKINEDRNRNQFPDAEITAPVDNTAAELEKQRKAHEKVQAEILKDIQDFYDERSNINAKNRDNEIANLNENYAAGEISEKEYRKELLIIERNYLRQSLEDEITAAEAKLLLLKKGSAEYNKLLAAIAAARVKISGIPIAEKSDDLKEFADDLQRIANIAATLSEAFSTIANISFQNQKNQLEELAAQEEKNYQRETRNIEQYIAGTEEKAQLQILADAKHATQQEEFARRQREIDNKKAQFDKAIGIMNIILGTAAAVAKATTVFEKIAFAALGAAQLAAAIAIKVPQYGEGTLDHKGGDAIVGEKNEPELVQHGNKAYVVDKPTYIKNLPRHAKVIPLREDISAMAARSIMQVIGIIGKGKEKNEAWDIARWQINQMKRMNKGGGTKKTQVWDFRNMEYLNRNVFHRSA